MHTGTVLPIPLSEFFCHGNNTIAPILQIGCDQTITASHGMRLNSPLTISGVSEKTFDA